MKTFFLLLTLPFFLLAQGTETEGNANTAQSSFSDKPWSFGVLYVPYSSGTIFSIHQSGYDSYYIISTNQFDTRFEGQWAYAFNPRLSLTFDLGYVANYFKNREESHYVSSDGQYQSDDGQLIEQDLDILILNVGIKYYLTPLSEKNVSAYFLAGFGKHIAFYSKTYEELFADDDPPSATREDNEEEFVEDMNSPWYINAGFGAEYAFNTALTLVANIRFLYSSASGTFQYKATTDYHTQTSKTDEERSQIVTQFALGLNFYFDL